MNTIPRHVTEILEANYMPYAMNVIVSRAIPEIDGFKPAHRKLLYTMYKMGLLNGNRVKSADVVGQTMRLNPHGDGAIYETLVRLTRGNDAMLHPFIDSKGNFGKHYSRDMAYAASRYTEVKLDAVCVELFKDIDKNCVDFVDNYNGTMKEPICFPTTFPNLLVTPNQGIAVGMASSVCSFNLKEVCAATIQYIKNPDADLLGVLKAPDFSTGGELIYNEKEITQVYETGRGSFKVRGRYRFDKKNSCIEIYEIPYTTSIEAIIDKIVSLVKTNKLRDVNDVRDETDLNGLKITIDIKKSADPDLIMRKLYVMSPLSDSFSCNFNLLIDGSPRTMGIKDILGEWVKFRSNCMKRSIAFEIENKKAKLHLLEGLSKILLDIDKAIAIIRKTEDDAKVIPNLMDGFDIDNIQAEFIADIKLRNLNKEYLLNRIKEHNGLKSEIEELYDTLSSDSKIQDLICKQLKEVSTKYGKERRTQIVLCEEETDVPADALIDDYGIRLFLTEHNYFKKIPHTSLRSSGEHNLKDNDTIIQELEATNKADILMFSNMCNVYKTKAYELNDGKTGGIGDYLTNVLGLEEREKIIYMVATYNYSGYMVFGFENGKFAKTLLENYRTKINRKKLINAYSPKARLVFIDWTEADRDYVAIRNTDKAMLFNLGLIPLAATKNASGIQAYKLKKNSLVTKVMYSQIFISNDIEHYRTNNLPSTGHFIVDADKRNV